MYKKRKKTRRYANGGINDDRFTRQDSVDVYNYRDLTNKLGGFDPVGLLKNITKKVRPTVDEALAISDLDRIRSIANAMGELGDFLPDPGETMTKLPKLGYKNGGITNDDDKFSRQDSIDVYEYRKLSDYMGEDAATAFQKKYNPKNPTVFDALKSLVETSKKSLDMGDLGDFVPDDSELSLPPKARKHGGMVDDSNQPDSLTNYIKGHDMKKNKKYRMGGMTDDDNFSKSDSIAAYNYTKAIESLGYDPVDALTHSNPFNKPVPYKLKLAKDAYRKIGPLTDVDLPEGFFETKKHGGMVKKSKGGHRDPFTNQYD